MPKIHEQFIAETHVRPCYYPDERASAYPPMHARDFYEHKFASGQSRNQKMKAHYETRVYDRREEASPPQIHRRARQLDSPEYQPSHDRRLLARGSVDGTPFFDYDFAPRQLRENRARSGRQTYSDDETPPFYTTIASDRDAPWEMPKKWERPLWDDCSTQDYEVEPSSRAPHTPVYPHLGMPRSPQQSYPTSHNGRLLMEYFPNNATAKKAGKQQRNSWSSASASTSTQGRSNPHPGHLTIQTREKNRREEETKKLDSVNTAPLGEHLATLWCGPASPPGRVSELSWSRLTSLTMTEGIAEEPVDTEPALFAIAGGPEALMAGRLTWQCLHVEDA
jgi:hypothetical protein